MKYATWDNPNKMHIDTGYKLFDRQTNVISHGNVFANTQASYIIRPYLETECHGKEYKPGELAKHDLEMIFGKSLWDYHNLVPWTMRRVIENGKRDYAVYLYEFRVWKSGKKRVIGFVLTDENYNLIDYRAVNYHRDSSYLKRHYTIMEAARYVCNDAI